MRARSRVRTCGAKALLDGAGCEAGHGPTRVLSFGSPSGRRDQMTFCIGRREFITLLGGAASVWPVAARAQSDRARRIGVLQAINESDPQGQLRKAPFVRGLQKFGWTEGANMMIDYRWGGDDADRIRLYATELTSMRPEVIWTSGA